MVGGRDKKPEKLPIGLRQIAIKYLRVHHGGSYFIHISKKDINYLDLYDNEHGKRNSIEDILKKVAKRNYKKLSGPIIWEVLGTKR